MKKLWGIPIITGYLYGATILTQAGFISYFGVPYNFLQISPTDVTIYAYDLFKTLLNIITLMPWWWWPIIVLIIIALAFVHDFFGKTIFVLILVALAGWFLYKSFDAGVFLAEHQTNFVVLSPGCPTVTQDKTYIVLGTYDGKGVLVLVDETTKKIGSGFSLEDISGSSCKLTQKDIGPIVKQ